MLQGDERGAARARALRQDMSLPEILLWRALRLRPARLKFRRQHPCGPFVADFYCHEARLVIEGDGEVHNRSCAPQDDERRDGWFTERGFAVLRIPAIEILNNLENAVAGIVATVKIS